MMIGGHGPVPPSPWIRHWVALAWHIWGVQVCCYDGRITHWDGKLANAWPLVGWVRLATVLSGSGGSTGRHGAMAPQSS